MMRRGSGEGLCTVRSTNPEECRGNPTAQTEQASPQRDVSEGTGEAEAQTNVLLEDLRLKRGAVELSQLVLVCSRVNVGPA